MVQIKPLISTFCNGYITSNQHEGKQLASKLIINVQALTLPKIIKLLTLCWRFNSKVILLYKNKKRCVHTEVKNNYKYVLH